MVADAIRRVDGGIPLKPIIRRALNMGDELHSRNAAATLLFTRELLIPLLDVAAERPDDARRTVEFMVDNDYFFLRLSMAASKATADCRARHRALERRDRDDVLVPGVRDPCERPRRRVVQLRAAGRRRQAVRRLHAEDIEFMGGESIINETVGLGGFAQAAAFPLQDYQGGSPEGMIANTERMYGITVAEHPCTGSRR